MKKDRVFEKILIFITLISILLILCVNYYENYESHLEFSPSQLNITGEQESNEFTIFGEVIRHQEYGFDLLDEDNNMIKVESTARPEIGSEVEVMGAFFITNYFKGVKVVKINKLGYETIFLRSIIGLVVIVIIFWRYWKFDFRHLEFIRRKEK